MARIPASASPDVQNTIRDLWAEIDRLKQSHGLNRDLKGTRMINAGDAVESSDYVTKRQLATLVAQAGGVGVDGDFRNLTVRQLARFLGEVLLGDDLDACLLYTEHGEIKGDQDNLSWRYTNNTLRLGPDTTIKWHHGAEFRSTGSAPLIIFEITGEDEGVTSVALIALGPNDGSAPGLKPSGTQLQVRKSDDSDYADLRCKNITADNVVSSGGNATFSTVAIATDPGGADPLRVGGGLTINDDQILTTVQPFANGAGGSAGTLTNAPAAGNPTKWIPINDNGTVRYMPAW